MVGSRLLKMMDAHLLHDSSFHLAKSNQEKRCLSFPHLSVLSLSVLVSSFECVRGSIS